ncbi:MAG: phosphate acyltransferase, partial [Burkholderiaceae bacterium]|nr:phosphate acyltransferase [Burkholderiaceae bacterium]
GLRLKAGSDFALVNPEDDPRFRQYWEAYHHLMGRDGITPEMAKALVRRSNTLIAALSVHLGHADGMLCGLVGRYEKHLDHVRDVIGLRGDTQHYAALSALMLDKYTLFVADAYVNEDPDAETLAEIAALAAQAVTQFGLTPKVAFLSHSMYGSSTYLSARKMRTARDLFVQRVPGVEADGEMQGDAALSEEVRAAYLPQGSLSGAANVLICPDLDAANILFNVLKLTGAQGVTVGPILLGTAAPANILTPSATVRRIVNMTALTVAASDQRA